MFRENINLRARVANKVSRKKFKNMYLIETFPRKVKKNPIREFYRQIQNHKHTAAPNKLRETNGGANVPSKLKKKNITLRAAAPMQDLSQASRCILHIGLTCQNSVYPCSVRQF
jgi:hypothetical protein